jgi:hypothetical protein
VLPAGLPTCGEPRPLHSAALSFLRRSMNAPLSLPLSPILVRAWRRAARGEQRITCVTRTSFRRR